jgi:hypothetical protein
MPATLPLDSRTIAMWRPPSRICTSTSDTAAEIDTVYGGRKLARSASRSVDVT